MRRIRPLWVIVLALVIGCSATPEQVAYRTVGITVHTVDTAMKIWADYVVSGQAIPDQEAKVRAAYSKYQEAAKVAKVALQATNTTPTPSDLSVAAAALVDLVQTFTHKQVKSTYLMILKEVSNASWTDRGASPGDSPVRPRLV